MKYTEKADIAAKAVKVLDSVTMKRQERSAIRYAKLASKCLIDRKATGREPMSRCFDDGSGIGMILEHGLGDALVSAFNIMKSRLDKPRYTLKDGEWVRKDSAKHFVDSVYGEGREVRINAPKHKDAQRLYSNQAAYMAQNMGMRAASFGGGTPYVGQASISDGLRGVY